MLPSECGRGQYNHLEGREGRRREEERRERGGEEERRERGGGVKNQPCNSGIFKAQFFFFFFGLQIEEGAFGPIFGII